jgi:CRP-like cAMP-binding protein
MHPVTLGAGEVVIKQGEGGGKEFYILEKGAAVATVAADGAGESVVVKEYGPSR